MWSGSKKVITPKLDKQIPRKNIIFKPKEDTPSYLPNFEIVKKSLGKVGPQFKKIQGRERKICKTS